MFFATSGYLMATLIRHQDPSRFMLHRIVRIYPMFFVVVSLVTIVSFVGNAVRLPHLMALSLMPWGLPYYPLGVEWTLVFEIAYYVVLFVIGLARLVPWIDAIALVWLIVLGIAAYIAIEPVGQNYFPAYLMPLVTANVSFAAGLLMPRLLRRNIHPLLLLLLAGALFFIGTWTPIWQLLRWTIGLSAALVIRAAVSFSRHGSFRPRDALSWTLAKLGDFSYALYLCHVPIILLVYRSFELVNPWAAWCVVVGLAVLACIPLGLLDVSLYRRLKLFVDNLPAATARIAACSYLMLFVAVTASVAYADHRGARPLSSDHWIVRAIVADDLGSAGQSPDIVGFIDSVTWLASGKLRLSGWAGDRPTLIDRSR